MHWRCPYRGVDHRVYCMISTCLKRRQHAAYSNPSRQAMDNDEYPRNGQMKVGRITMQHRPIPLSNREILTYNPSGSNSRDKYTKIIR